MADSLECDTHYFHNVVQLCHNFVLQSPANSWFYLWIINLACSELPILSQRYINLFYFRSRRLEMSADILSCIQPRTFYLHFRAQVMKPHVRHAVVIMFRQNMHQFLSIAYCASVCNRLWIILYTERFNNGSLCFNIVTPPSWKTGRFLCASRVALDQ